MEQGIIMRESERVQFRNLFTVFLLLIQLSSLYAQPATRFGAFDWVQYRQTGAISALTSDQTYLYAGTQNGGIWRYHLYGNRFDEPITQAQGLASHRISAVHTAFGVLWAATEKGLEFSITKEGDWQKIPFSELGIHKNGVIERIGNSEHFIWLMTPGLFYKCDRTTGIVVSRMPYPDEENINWSAGVLSLSANPSQFLMNYSMMDGWIYTLFSFISPSGKEITPTVIYKDQLGEIWIGTSDGTIFYGDNSLKTLNPITMGLAGNDIMDLSEGNSFWLAGRLNFETSGITFADPDRYIFDKYEFDEVIHLDAQSITATLELKNEVWFGSQDGIVVYNKKKDFWRHFGQEKGIPFGTIRTFVFHEGWVWVGTSRGLFKMDPVFKKVVKSELDDIFHTVFVYDMGYEKNRLWVASELGLTIYDANKKKLYSYLNYGYHGDKKHLPSKGVAFTSLSVGKYKVFAASKYGILQFNISDRKWSKAVDVSLWGGTMIRTMDDYKQTIFFADSNRLIRYDMNDTIAIVYKYPFMGEVNDLYISHKTLWLGTSEGLISFKWTKESL